MEEVKSRNNIQVSRSTDSEEEEDTNLLGDVSYLIDRPESPPKDKFMAVYLIFYLMGVGTLLPWNMFITAKGYFTYQLRNISLPAEDYNNEPQTPLQLSYESAIAASNMIANLVVQILSTSLAGRLSMRKRLIGSMTLMILMFLMTLIFTKLDVSQWQATFYALTLVTVVFASASSALFGSSLFGLAAQFPQRYTQAVMGGMGLGGVFSAVVEIITISAGGTVTTSGFWYFFLAILVIIFALVTYLLMYRLDFAKYHRKQHQRALLESVRQTTPKSYLSEYLAIAKKIWRYALSVVLVFFVTLAVFPATTSNVHPMNPSRNSIWAAKYFLPVYCFLLFNVGDLVGRTVAGWINIKWPGVTIPLLSVLRVVFIPLFALCNVQPRSSLPVIFNHDAYPIVIMAVFAISNGYLSTQSLMIPPTIVEKQQAEMVGTMMSLFMTIGLACGSGLSYAIVLAIKNM